MTAAPTYYLLYTALLGLLGVAVLCTRKSRQTSSSIAALKGPLPSSWLAGSLPAWVRAENVGDADFECVEKYGLVFKIKGPFNSNSLYLADPLAIQYVLNTCGYTFHKKDTAFLFRLISGRSIIAVEGQDHVRQRKILLPGFSQGVLKDFVPVFTQTARKLVENWRGAVQEDGQPSSVIEVRSWLSRLTLDAIGQGAFTYDFGALDDTPSEFIRAYRNLFVDMFHKPTDAQLASMVIIKYMPLWLIPVLRLLPHQGMKRMTNFQAAARKIASSIVQREMQALEGGHPIGKDIMSNLVRANMSENPKNKMSDDELLSQMMAIMLAGLDTTAATLVWVFYEVSRHPEVQLKLREEVRAARVAYGELGATHLESMTYTIAVIKETLRFYPIAAHNSRTAGRDEVIPLSIPVTTVSGHEITSISVKKNDHILMSIWAYNRIKGLWGDDAEEWNPERFLDGRLNGRPKNSVGIYANLATFSSGVHACIGWRFAVLQMQVVLITLIENFEFSPPPGELRILRGSAPTLIPVVQGQEHRGAQMPLTVRPIN